MIFSACGGDEEFIFDPNQPGASFQPLTDEGARETQLLDMWRVLTAQNCWDASFVGDPTIVGSPAAVAQLGFNGNFEYRYVSTTDIYFGAIRFFDIGQYDGHPTLILETWTGGTEGLVISDDDRFAHVLTNPEGFPFAMYYRPVGSNCL